MASPIPPGEDFKFILSQSSKVLFITGEGISPENDSKRKSIDDHWRSNGYSEMLDKTSEYFQKDPSLVWKYHHQRRKSLESSKPNPAHVAIARFQKKMAELGKQAFIITETIDGLHQNAGTQDVVELHGSVFHTKCVKCCHIEENKKIPIVPALENTSFWKFVCDSSCNVQDLGFIPEKDLPSVADSSRNGKDHGTIPEKDLPRCSKLGCESLVHLHVVFPDENIPDDTLVKSEKIMDSCDFCIVVGTSVEKYPAAMFIPSLEFRCVPIAEFDLKPTDSSNTSPTACNKRLRFYGTAEETLIPLLQSPDKVSYW